MKSIKSTIIAHCWHAGKPETKKDKRSTRESFHLMIMNSVIIIRGLSSSNANCAKAGTEGT